MRRHLGRLTAAALLILGAAAGPLSAALAETISFEATVDATKIPLGTAGQLTLTVRGTQDIDKIDLPKINGFETRYIGPSTQLKVVNGEYSTAKAFSYLLLPLKEGTFTIPSIDIDIKGQTYRSAPLTLQVLAAASAGEETAEDPLADPQALAEKVRTRIVVPREQCYINEELPLLVRLYVRDLPMQDITLPDIRQEGFVLSEYGQPRQYQETIDGQTFHVVEFATRITPLRSGSLMVGPAVVGANLVFKTNVRKNPFGGNTLFEDDFFANFLGGYQKRPLTITAPPVVLSVRDLPSGDVPANFSGGVGRFTFDVEVSPEKVLVGDPVTLRMIVSGIGNLKAVAAPVVKDERFKIYEPQIKEEDGRKIFEQVLIPTSEEIKSIPPVAFSYFDVDMGRYQTMTRGPFPIEVTPPEKGQEFKAIGFAEKPVSLIQETFGKDIVFIKDHPGSLKPRADLLARQAPFYAVLVIFLNIWGALLSLFLYRRRLSSDAGFARRAAAYREALQALKDVRGRIPSGDAGGFYDGLSAALRAYAVGKLQLAPGEVHFESMEKALAPYRVDKKELLKLHDVLRKSDEVRFAALAVGEQEMMRDYLDAEEVIEAIERRVR